MIRSSAVNVPSVMMSLTWVSGILRRHHRTLQRKTEFKGYNIHLFWHQSYNIKEVVLIGVAGLLDNQWRSPCPDSSTVLLTPPFPSLNSMAYLPVSFSVGSVICSHSWSPTTPLLIRSEKAMAESLAARRRNAQQTHHTLVVDVHVSLEGTGWRTHL